MQEIKHETKIENPDEIRNLVIDGPQAQPLPERDYKFAIGLIPFRVLSCSKKTGNLRAICINDGAALPDRGKTFLLKNRPYIVLSVSERKRTINAGPVKPKPPAY